MMKKNVILAAAAVGVLSLAVGQTMAYFTARQVETNTFTVGNLKVTETEPAWDNDTDGKDMYPGTTLYKDPTVENTSDGEAGSEPGYVRMYIRVVDSETNQLVTDTERLNLILATIKYDETYRQSTMSATQFVEGNKPGYTSSQIAGISMYNTDAFTKDDSRSSAGNYCFNYNSTLAKGDKATLFTTVIIPTDWGNENLAKLGSYKLEVSVEAIQSKGFNNANEAFAALDVETGKTT